MTLTCEAIIPKPCFKKDRKLLGVLAHTPGAFLTECLRHSCGHREATPPPGIVAVIQTAGDNLKFNPHIHILSTEGCLVDDEKNHYHVAGFMDYDIMRVAWRERILSVLVDKGVVDRNWAARLKRRYPKGFMLNGFIQDHRGDRNLMKRMASYITKLPISEKRIVSFDEKPEKVLIRYKDSVKIRSKLLGMRVAVKNQLELLDPAVTGRCGRLIISEEHTPSHPYLIAPEKVRFLCFAPFFVAAGRGKDVS